MGMMKAARLYPQAILLPVDFDEYRRYSRWFKQLILKIAPAMEKKGSEIQLDIRHCL